ncbi:MAG: hypothetical protein IPL30_11120 [Elusimicrobia bacterium]|nr:hypothetical protein [Elusimicrobiota bacterium]
MGKEKDGWEIMAGRKPEFDIPPDGYETAPVAVADDAPPDGYEGPSIGYKGVGASGSWDQPQPAVVPQPVVPHIQMPQNPDAMSTYKEALTAYLVGNRDLAKAKAEAALSLDTGLTEAKNMLTRMRVNPLAGTNAPRPEYSPQKFTDYTVGQMAADTYNAIDQSPVVRTLGSGVARIGAGLSRVPNLAANIFALPYNTIVTLTGNEDMAQRSPKMFEKEARWWDEKATQLSEGFRRWGSKGEDFVSVAKRKDPGEIASYIAYKVLEEAPQQAIVIGTTMAGIPAAGLSYMGASSSAQELAATPENVNPAAATVNAIVNGTVEAALEQTPALMGKWSKAIEEAVGKKGRGEVIKAVAKTIGSSIVQEGLVEEAPTEYLQSASRVMTGVDPNAMQGVGGRMIEAATIGGAMGGGMTAPAAIGSGIQMGAGKLGPGDFPPDGFNENNTPQGPIPPSSIGQSVAPLDIKQNPNYSLGDESARLAGSSDSVVNVPGVLDLRRGADAPVVPADRVLPSAIPADANIPAPVQSPGNYERVALPQSPAIPNLEQPAPAESQSALPQPPQLDQQQPRIIPAREARVSENELNRYPVEDRPRLKSLAESIHKEAVSDYQISRSRFQHWREILGPGIKPPKIIGGERDTMGEYNTLPVWQKSKAGREMDRVVSDAIEAGLIGDEKDIYDALRKLQAPRRPISPDSFLEEAANIMAYETEQESIEPNPTYPISTEIEGQFQAEQEQSNLFDVPKENVGDSYVRLIAQARRQGMTVPEAVKFAKARISQFGKPQTEQTQEKQSEFGVAGGVQGFGVQRRGQTEMFQAGEETTETAKGQTEALTAFDKIISANKMTDAVFAELVDSIRPDPAAFRKGYGTEYSADKFAIRGATYPIRNHPTIRALVRFAKGAHQGTGYHEAMHVIFNNVLTVQERQVLMDKFGTEEQAAEAFARYEAKRTGMEKPSRIKAIFDKILELLGQLRSYMAGKGWKTANDVMRSVEEGRTERRRAAGRGEAKYQAERVESDKAMLPNGGYVPLAKLSKLQRIYREWLTTDRGVGQAIDRANEERIGKIMETAFDAPVTGKQLLKYFKENPSDDLRQAVFEALTGQRSIFELPADITGIVQKMREDVDALSRVIAQTAAPNDRLKAVIERNLGRYLGRHYKLFERKNWRPSNEVISRAKAKLREMHPNTIGKASSQELNGIIENIISKGDVTFHRGDRRIDIPQNHFVKRKDIPKEIRDLYGEITDPVWAYLKTMADQSTVAHNADFLSKISGMEGVFKDKPDETHFKQIPDVARWGAVRGKFTTQEVNDFLIEAIDPVDSGLFRFVEKLIVNPFKWTKTVASLPSHPRNFIGNTMFSVLAGNTITNPANIPYYWKALRVIMGKEGKYRGTWKELVRARVADTQFWGSEMPKLMAEMISDPVSWPDKIMNTVKWPVEKLGELYNNEDLIYRVSAFLKYRDNGMTVNQAAQEVDKWFTNYARLPKAVKTARRIGVFGPFLSFKANTARILINAAKESGEGIKKGNPAPALRLAFVVSFIPLLQMAMRTVFDIDDDEKKNLDKLQDMGPIYKRNSTPIYYRTAEGSIKAFDLGYIWPTGEFDKAARAALVGDAESFTDSIDLFQHPLFDAYSILFNNFNTRNRQNVANVNDPMPRRAADKMAELARMLYVPASSPIPSIRGLAKGRYEPGLLTGYQIKTLYDAYHGVEDRFGRTREVPEELRAFFTGIRTWEIRPDDTKKAFRMRKAGEFQEAKRELRRYMRMPGISQEEKERRMDDWKRRVAKIRSDVESSNSVKLK